MAAILRIFSHKSSPAQPQAPIAKADVRSMTDAKIKRAALVSFAAMTAAGGCALTCAGLASAVSVPVALLSIPLFAASFGLMVAASHTHDYSNPVELKKMKETALTLSFSQLVREHGLKNIQHYQIVTPERLRQKFLEENCGRSFTYIAKKYSLHTIRTYDLIPLEQLKARFKNEMRMMGISGFYDNVNVHLFNDLRKYDIITPKQMVFLNGLCNRFATQRNHFNSAVHQIERKFWNRTDCLVARLNDRESAARQKARYMINRPQANRWLKGELDQIFIERQRIEHSHIGQSEQMGYGQEMAHLDGLFRRDESVMTHELHEIING